MQYKNCIFYTGRSSHASGACALQLPTWAKHARNLKEERAEEERLFLRLYGLVLDTKRGRYLMEDEEDKPRSNWIITQHNYAYYRIVRRGMQIIITKIINGFLTTTPLEGKLFTFTTVGETVHG